MFLDRKVWKNGKRQGKDRAIPLKFLAHGSVMGANGSQNCGVRCPKGTEGNCPKGTEGTCPKGTEGTCPKGTD
jgi:hypothetical protein